jgi:xanthine permease XanP
MADKPANLTYGVDDRPALWTTFLLGLQHVLPMSSTLMLPVLIVAAMPGATAADSRNFLRVSILAGGLSTIFTAMRWRWFGAGYLCPSLCGPAYFPASMAAASQGGLPLVFGMTAFSGLIKAALAPLARRLRPLFPPEVTGLVIMMIGIALINSGITQFFGIGLSGRGDMQATEVAVEGVIVGRTPAVTQGRAGGPAEPAVSPAATARPSGATPAPSRIDSRIALRWPTIATALLTLLAMVGFNIWGKGPFRLFSLLFGMVVGYFSAWLLTRFTGVPILTSEDLHRVTAQPIVAFPKMLYVLPTFSWSLAIPFTLAAFSSYVKAVGNITTCQQINDSDWKRVEMKSISGGLLANATGTVVSGLLGGMSMETSTSNVGLSAATGATSRVIAFAAGAIFVAMGFLPMLAEAIIIMPQPVQGAMLIYVTTFMILGGIQILTSRMLDARRTFIVGLAIVFGMAADLKAAVYSGVPGAIRPLFESALALSTALVLVLNLALRIGVAKKRTWRFRFGEDPSSKIRELMTTAGAEWGARREVISQATTAMIEFYESAENCHLKSPEIVMQVSFTEFNFDVEISYEGEPVDLPDARPSKRELVEDETAEARLAGYVIRRSAASVRSYSDAGRQVLCLHYDH